MAQNDENCLFVVSDGLTFIVNMASSKLKLCYILPEYDEKTATHFAHIFDFIKRLSGEFNLLVIIECLNGTKDIIDFGDAKIVVLRSRSFFFRFFELSFRVKLARFSGYRDFYVHYSFLGAFISSLVVKFLGGRVYYWNCGEPWKYKRNIFRDMFEKFTYKIITYLVTGTDLLKKEYAKHYYSLPLEKIKVMPNWIDIQKFQITNHKFQKDDLKNELNIKTDEKVILFIHRLSKRKGAHYLPEIIKSFKDEKVVFVIIGDGPEREALKFQVSSLKLQGKVWLLGWVPNKDLPLYYALSDMFLIPSDEEGFPRVLLEAMVMKVPFVASGVGGVKEIIPTAFLEYVCPAGDINCFSSKIKKLLSLSQEERIKLMETEYLWVKKYDVSLVVEQFKALFA